jgi:hypothetical protein
MHSFRSFGTTYRSNLQVWIIKKNPSGAKRGLRGNRLGSDINMA